LLLETLRYANEVKDSDTIFDGIPNVTPDKEMLALANQLIKKKTHKFDPDKFKSHYAAALRALINEKKKTGEVSHATDEELGVKGQSNVIDLMAALRASVKGKAAAKSGKGPTPEENGRQEIARGEQGRQKRAEAEEGQLADGGPAHTLPVDARLQGVARAAGKVKKTKGHLFVVQSTTRHGCISTSGWSWMAFSRAGRLRVGRASILLTSVWQSRWRITRSSMAGSKA
jgi:hypothetical protein